MRLVYSVAIVSFFAAGVLAQTRTSSVFTTLQEVRKECKFNSLQIETKELIEVSVLGFKTTTVTVNHYYYKKGNVRIEGKVVNDTGITLIINNSMAYIRKANGAAVTTVNIEKEYNAIAFFGLGDLHSLIKMGRGKKTGTDMVGGVQCDVYKDSGSGKEVVTWYRDKDGIALGMFSPSMLGDQTVTITEMEKNGKLPDKLFDASSINETGSTVIRTDAATIAADAMDAMVDEAIAEQAASSEPTAAELARAQGRERGRQRAMAQEQAEPVKAALPEPVAPAQAAALSDTPTAGQLAKALGRERNRRGTTPPPPAAAAQTAEVPASVPGPAKATTQESGPTLESLTAEIEKDPKNVKAYLQRGDLYFRIRKEAEAIADYEKFIELGKSDATLAAQVSSAELKVKKMKMMFEMRDRRSPRR